MAHDFSGRFCEKCPVATGTFEKVVLSSRSECYKRQFGYHLFKAFLMPASDFRGRFLVNARDKCN